MADNALNSGDISAIDKAIAAANARKAAKSGSTAKTPKAPKEPKAPAEPKRPRLSDADKAAKLAQRETERAARKATRETTRIEKLAARESNRAPAHMKKVARAAEKLSALGQAALLLFNEATNNLTAAELANLALQIQHFNRVKATERALTQKIAAGQTVEIVGGDPRFIGKTGTVAKAQRIRCYVTVEGQSKAIYLFTSDVQVKSPVTVAATA